MRVSFDGKVDLREQNLACDKLLVESVSGATEGDLR